VAPGSPSLDDVRLANERIAECARAAGIDAVPDENGEGVEVISGKDQTGSVNEVIERCQRDHGIAPVQYTPAEERRLYEATVRQAECLEEVTGVDLSEPPSPEVWIESRGAVWSPVVELGEILEGEGRFADEEDAIRACPSPR
jgi:hypothetical protein